MSSREENTSWIRGWILNDPDEANYWKAKEVAQEACDAGDYDILRDHLEALLKSGASGAIIATAREMSDADYDNTDWAEVAHDLIDL